MKIILASASPRRRELLTQIGLKFEVQVSDAEEKITANKPQDAVMEIAAIKAKAVESARKAKQGEIIEDTLIIGADTVVVFEETILGKPKDKEDAVRMLGMLQGKTHQVYTGVALLMAGKQYGFYEKTDVIFCPMTEEEIREYVATGDPMDKAGAYGIQGFCARYIREIHGDYNNVVGLPIGRLYQELKRMGEIEAYGI